MLKYLTTAALLLILLAMACEPATRSNATGQSSASRAEDDNISVMRGEQIYRQQCVLCHGTDGKLGLNDAGDLTESRATLDERIHIITHGKGLMLPYRRILTENEIHSVALYTMELNGQ